MRERLAFDHDGHKGSVEEDCDWGGPCEYKPACSCGWFGSTLGDVLYADGSGTVGTRYEAFVELLDHMGLTVVDYINKQEVLVDRGLESICNLSKMILETRFLIDEMRELTG